MNNKELISVATLAVALLFANNATAEIDFSKFPPEVQAMMKAKLARDGYKQQLKTLPADSYRGGDKDKLKQIAKDEFARLYPNQKILATRIQMDGWERYTDKRWSTGSNSWYMVNYSTIQVLVAAPKNNKTAVLYPVNITKDHTKNDKIEVDAKSDRKTNAIFLQEIPIKNIR